MQPRCKPGHFPQEPSPMEAIRQRLAHRPRHPPTHRTLAHTARSTSLLHQATHVKPSPDAWGAACYAKAGWSPGLAAERRKAEGSGAAATDWRREWSAPSSGRSAGACRTESGGPGDQTTTWGLSEESSAAASARPRPPRTRV